MEEPMTKYIHPQTHCRRKNHGCAVVLLGATPGLYYLNSVQSTVYGWYEYIVYCRDEYGHEE